MNARSPCLPLYMAVNRLCVDTKAKETLGRRTDFPMKVVDMSNTEERDVNELAGV